MPWHKKHRLIKRGICHSRDKNKDAFYYKFRYKSVFFVLLIKEIIILISGFSAILTHPLISIDFFYMLQKLYVLVFFCLLL